MDPCLLAAHSWLDVLSTLLEKHPLEKCMCHSHEDRSDWGTVGVRVLLLLSWSEGVDPDLEAILLRQMLI